MDATREFIRDTLAKRDLGITGEALQLIEEQQDKACKMLVERAGDLRKHANRKVRILSKLT